MTDPAIIQLDEAISEIKAELERARKKFPWWPQDILHAVSVLQEEVGELQRAALQFVYEQGSKDSIRTEATQAGAMVIRLLTNLYSCQPIKSPQIDDGQSDAGQELDWERAKNHLDESIEAYEFVGAPGSLALAMFIRPLKTRYEAGERSEELFREIMEIS